MAIGDDNDDIFGIVQRESNSYSKIVLRGDEENGVSDINNTEPAPQSWLKPGNEKVLNSFRNPLSYQSTNDSIFTFRNTLLTRLNGQKITYYENGDIDGDEENGILIPNAEVHNYDYKDYFDEPGHLYFKIVFHFWNGDAYGVGNGLESGLIIPSWIAEFSQYGSGASGSSTANVANTANGSTGNNSVTSLTGVKVAAELDGLRLAKGDSSSLKADHVNFINAQLRNGSDPDKDFEDMASKNPYHNSAYNYLILNDEIERAEKLKTFIELLSNISSYTPWYFTEITGLDGLLERPVMVGDDPFKVEAPKQITIKCLADSIDNRIATLLDLYREIVYSQTWHREILPSNLRKFDMSIYIFNSRIAKINTKIKSGELTYNAVMDEYSPASYEYPVSYKRIELHDCQIDYNSSKSGYTSVNNTEGFQQTFDIVLSVGEAYETRYNQFTGHTIGDMLWIDIARARYTKTGRLAYLISDELPNLNIDWVNLANTVKYGDKEGFFNKEYLDTPDKMTEIFRNQNPGGIDIFSAIDKTIGKKTGINTKKLFNKYILGNIYEVTITDVAASYKDVWKNLTHLGDPKPVKEESLKDYYKEGYGHDSISPISVEDNGETHFQIGTEKLSDNNYDRPTSNLQWQNTEQEIFVMGSDGNPIRVKNLGFLTGHEEKYKIDSNQEETEDIRDGWTRKTLL